MTGDGQEGLEERRKRLETELSAKRAGETRFAVDEERAASNRKGYQVAVKLSSEFVAAIIVGALLGYLLDHFAGTGPWGDDHTSSPRILCRCAECPAICGHGGRTTPCRSTGQNGQEGP